MRTIKASVILSSGTGQSKLDYVIGNVEEFGIIDKGGYYFIKTKNEEYYFPIERTIIIKLEHK